jgi:hypothetical protein
MVYVGAGILLVVALSIVLAIAASIPSPWNYIVVFLIGWIITSVLIWLAIGRT